MKKNGRYWMFAFDNKHSRGGINDFIFSFNNISEFEENILHKINHTTYQVLDTNTNYHFEGDIGTVTKWVCKNIGGEIYEK